MNNEAWRAFAGDFNSMTDAEIETETQIAQNHIDENEAWVEAVASWKAAGKPRTDFDLQDAILSKPGESLIETVNAARDENSN
ncbi:hypothetical protein [Celeribacter naphthalenivorans]|uniref:hypothetical protein n=1 Tax=Celeribacter naphthalenivorans TaxID=1614694 RepID=UPI001CFB6C87|nr:hypothetical protein [Celeribacter naphthalenivorans]